MDKQLDKNALFHHLTTLGIRMHFDCHWLNLSVEKCLSNRFLIAVLFCTKQWMGISSDFETVFFFISTIWNLLLRMLLKINSCMLYRSHHRAVKIKIAHWCHDTAPALEHIQGNHTDKQIRMTFILLLLIQSSRKFNPSSTKKQIQLPGA